MCSLRPRCTLRSFSSATERHASVYVSSPVDSQIVGCSRQRSIAARSPTLSLHSLGHESLSVYSPSTKARRSRPSEMCQIDPVSEQTLPACDRRLHMHVNTHRQTGKYKYHAGALFSFINSPFVNKKPSLSTWSAQSVELKKRASGGP
jgi:hypothetical protein